MIPASSAELTPAWLSSALGADVVDVEVEDLGTGLGLLGEVCRLRLRHGSGSGSSGPERLIAKLQSPAAENAFVAQVMGFYAREVSFYRCLSSLVSVRVPRCFHAEIDDAGAPFVLLLEEIVGARSIDQIAGATRAEAEQVVDLAVRLHAQFWGEERLAQFELDWLPPMDTPLNLLAGELAAAKWPAFQAYWDGRLPAGAMAFVEALTPHYPALLSWWVAQGHPTYAHTDFRADNLLFGGSAGDGEIALLDWQLSARGVGVWDVANFLAGSVTVDDRREWEADLVRRYHSGLVAAGVAAYSWERCWRDYRYSIAQQAWSTLPMGDVDPGNDRGRRLLDVITPRYHEAAMDLGAEELLDLF